MSDKVVSLDEFRKKKEEDNTPTKERIDADQWFSIIMNKNKGNKEREEKERQKRNNSTTRSYNLKK